MEHTMTIRERVNLFRLDVTLLSVGTAASLIGWLTPEPVQSWLWCVTTGCYVVAFLSIFAALLRSHTPVCPHCGDIALLVHGRCESCDVIEASRPKGER